MDQILLVIHGMIAVALVASILLQRSEGGALGIGGGGGGGMMTARGAGNFLTKATAILATVFILMSIGLAIRSGITTEGSLMDDFLNDDQAAEELVPVAPVDSGLPAIPEPGSAPVIPEPNAVPMSMNEALQNIDPNAVAVPPVEEDAAP